MLIANPIYDVVFKYMMDDNRVAKLLISAIISEEIVELEFRPKEKVVEISHEQIENNPNLKNLKGRITFFTVYRLDFSAVIKTKEGEHKKVLIEIQKAKYPTDIMRFRKYLGEQYSSEENVYMAKEPKPKYKKALPIISIYFLGHILNHTKAPVIKVARKYYNIITGKEIVEKEEFIESLTHDSYIIQIPYLKSKRQTELLILLSVFDQSNISHSIHILNVNETNFPEKYRPIIRRLQKAVVEPKVKDTMDIEDEIVEGLEMLERDIAERERIISEKVQLIQKKEQEIIEKDKTIKETNFTISETIKKLRERGYSNSEIAKITGLLCEKVNKI